MPLHVVLYQPQIPPNTGNVIRLCANTGAKLHLIEPLGFTLDNTRLRRAGLDYHQWADMSVHASLDDCLRDKSGNVWGFTTKASRAHSAATFADDDVLLFGPETRGLPDTVLASLTKDQLLRIPMVPQSRSINLANTVAIALYEAWRQLGFPAGN
jgi:tRNA (cytidine(34)-2'-O)-methyltransferase